MRRAGAWRAGALLIALVLVWNAPPIARSSLRVTHGLTAQAFTNPNGSGVRWFGYLTVFSPARYRFGIGGDPSATLSIDGVNGTDFVLDRGAHFVLIERPGGQLSDPLDWAWSREQRDASPVPPWRTSPVRVEAWRLLVVRGLEWLRVTLVAVAAIVGVLIAFQRYSAPVSAAARRFPAAATLALFVCLAILHTWPLASDPAHLSRHDNSDSMLNEWAMAWIAHQLPRDPLHLFDANIFYPETDTLAYSEAMLVQAAMGAPLFWLGASPLFVYNIVLLAGLALTAWATSLVMARWTGSWAAGVLAGTLLAFNAHTLTRLPHLQAMHVEFFAPALFALDRLLADPRLGHALRLALWFSLQALTSIYLLVFTAFALAAAAVVRPADWLGARFARVAALIGLAAAVSIVALLPYLLPYWRVYHETGASRPFFDVILYSASWRDYLSSSSHVHFNLWSHRVFTGTGLFPGVTGSLLTAAAIASGRAFSDRRARMCFALGIVGVLLSFGAALPGYETLFRVLPPLQSIRAVSRFGFLGLAAVACLAGFGLVELRQRIGERRWPAVAGAILSIAVLEPLVAPIHFSRFNGVSPLYESIANAPNAVVAELPMPGGFAWFGNARFMLNSTRHWKPMLNGYSGFAPPSFHEHARMLAGFPDRASIAALHTLGVTHIFVHTNGFTDAQHRALNDTTALRRVAAEQGAVLFEVVGK